MASPVGNQFWKARSKHGRDRLFASDELLWEACCEYFQWVEDNPLFEMKPFAYQGEVVQEPVAKMRAMTINGLCLFLNIDLTTWRAWREVDDFSIVVAKAEQIIYEQKFTGAAADLLNANIIARDLGLAEKRQVESTATVKVAADMSPQDAARAYQELMGEV
jgi:hypothetical protein